MRYVKIGSWPCKCQKWLSGILKIHRQHYLDGDLGIVSLAESSITQLASLRIPALLYGCRCWKINQKSSYFNFFSDRPEVWMTCARSSTNPKSMIEVNWIKRIVNYSVFGLGERYFQYETPKNGVFHSFNYVLPKLLVRVEWTTPNGSSVCSPVKILSIGIAATSGAQRATFN